MVGRAPWYALFVALLVVCATWSVPVAARADRLDLRGHVEAFWSVVWTQDRPGLRDRLFGRGREEQPAVGRFSSEGGPTFTLDQSATRPLLRFEGSGEIWALRPSAGVRGDIYYRNDVGEVMLRATRIGGLTLYTAANPGGLPCALEGGARPLRLQSYSVSSLFNLIRRESARAAQAVRSDFIIVADDFDDSAADLVGDTAVVAVDGLTRLGQTQSGRERLAGLRELQIVIGTSPGVRRNGASLVITIAPRLGPAGRPSSARVIRALQD